MYSGINTFIDHHQSKPTQCVATMHEFKMMVIEGGFPHSEILGSKLVRSSPRLIAAYHVLHRLLAPRHPPDTLIALDCSHYRCPPSPFTSAEERESLSCSAILADETAKPDTTFKDQLLLRTYPGTERSSLPTAGMHDHIQIFQIGTNAAHQTRDHPDMFPLHDVLEPANPLINARGVTNGTSETCFMDEASAHQRSTAAHQR